MNISKLQFKNVLSIAVIGFILQFVWEYSQAPLYSCYIFFYQCLWLCFRATLGDVVITLLLYGVFLKTRSKSLILILGFFIAWGIEVLALSSGRWSYNELMPLIPVLKVGLTPVLQMSFLPLLTFYLQRKFFNAHS